MRSQTSSARDSVATESELRPALAGKVARRADRLCVAGLGLLAVLVLHARLRLAILDPTNVGWMQFGDWSNYLHGWSFYRWDSWRFPIGYFSNLLHPIGTSTGLTDSVPWLALIGKIFDPWLPNTFQYFGLFFLLCFFLQGLFGFRIMMLLSRDRLHSMLSAAFLMVAPVLLDRTNHIALCAQWMILAPILWNVSGAMSPRSSQACCRKATALNLLAAATHPYLWVMTFVLSLPLFARPRREPGTFVSAASLFVAWTMLQLVLAALAWWVFGYLVIGSVGDWGFGAFGGSLDGFFNSAGKTVLTPPINAVKVPREGFAFAGLGIALIVPLLAVTWAKRRLVGWRGTGRTAPGPWLPSSRLFPLLVLTTGLWLFSLGNLAHLFLWLGPLTGAFRSSGRFAWPLYYCVVLFLLWNYRRAFPSRVASAGLLLLLALQVYDLKPFWLHSGASRPIPQVGADPFWREAGNSFRHLVLWPGSGELCGGLQPFEQQQVQAFLFYASGQRMTINIGATSRPPRENIWAECEVTRLALSADQPQPETLYVIQPQMLSSETLSSFRNFACHEIDGFQVCAAAPLFHNPLRPSASAAVNQSPDGDTRQHSRRHRV